jgi:hypothetical protein
MTQSLGMSSVNKHQLAVTILPSPCRIAFSIWFPLTDYFAQQLGVSAWCLVPCPQQHKVSQREAWLFCATPACAKCIQCCLQLQAAPLHKMCASSLDCLISYPGCLHVLLPTHRMRCVLGRGPMRAMQQGPLRCQRQYTSVCCCGRWSCCTASCTAV